MKGLNRLEFRCELSFGNLRLEKVILLMDKILHDLNGSKLWELRYNPYNG